jgi:hypothetical protein
MSRTTSAVAAAMAWLALLVLLAGCATGPSTTEGPLGSASIGEPASGAPGDSGAADTVPTSPVDGVLIHIDAKGLSEVTAFTLRLATGRQITFRLGTLENGAQFPPGHLAEHMATSAPVRVWFRPDGPDLVVYRIEDAPASPSP